MSLHATSPTTQNVAALQREAMTLRRDHQRALEDHHQEIEDLRRNLRRAEEDKQQEVEILKRALRRTEEDKRQAEDDLKDHLLSCQASSRFGDKSSPDMSNHEQHRGPISTLTLEESQMPAHRNKQQAARPLESENSDLGSTLSLTASIPSIFPTNSKDEKRLCPWNSPAPRKVARSLQESRSNPMDNPFYRDYIGEEGRKVLKLFSQRSREEHEALAEKQFQEGKAQAAERERREWLGEERTSEILSSDLSS
jgi:hypothetical protein